MRRWNIWDTKEKQTIERIPIDLIVSSPYQPRSRYDLDEISGLASSIAHFGLLTPLLLRKIRGNRYELLAGERRLRACQQLDMQEIPAVVVDLKENEVGKVIMSERIHQTTLSPVERAETYDRLLRDSSQSSGELAKELGIRASEVSADLEYLRLSAGTRRLMEEHRIDGEQMREVMKQPKEEKEALFSILQAECETPKDRDFPLPQALTVYKNTIQKTVGMLNLAGAEANSETVEKDDCVEYIIRIPK